MRVVSQLARWRVEIAIVVAATGGSAGEPGLTAPLISTSVTSSTPVMLFAIAAILDATALKPAARASPAVTIASFVFAVQTRGVEFEYVLMTRSELAAMHGLAPGAAQAREAAAAADPEDADSDAWED